MITTAIFFAWFSFGLGFLVGALWKARRADDDEQHIELLDRDK